MLRGQFFRFLFTKIIGFRASRNAHFRYLHFAFLSATSRESSSKKGLISPSYWIMSATHILDYLSVWCFICFQKNVVPDTGVPILLYIYWNQIPHFVSKIPYSVSGRFKTPASALYCYSGIAHILSNLFLFWLAQTRRRNTKNYRYVAKVRQFVIR